MLMRIFGPRREEMAGGCRKLQNEELCNLYSSSDIVRIISKRIRWASHVTRIEKVRNSYKILVGNPERKIQLGRSRSRCEDNIKIDLGSRFGECGLDPFAHDSDRRLVL
jgi:hypothetical protein